MATSCRHLLQLWKSRKDISRRIKQFKLNKNTNTNTAIRCLQIVRKVIIIIRFNVAVPTLKTCNFLYFCLVFAKYSEKCRRNFCPWITMFLLQCCYCTRRMSMNKFLKMTWFAFLYAHFACVWTGWICQHIFSRCIIRSYFVGSVDVIFVAKLKQFLTSWTFIFPIFWRRQFPCLDTLIQTQVLTNHSACFVHVIF